MVLAKHLRFIREIFFTAGALPMRSTILRLLWENIDATCTRQLPVRMTELVQFLEEEPLVEREHCHAGIPVDEHEHSHAAFPAVVMQTHIVFAFIERC